MAKKPATLNVKIEGLEALEAKIRALADRLCARGGADCVIVQLGEPRFVNGDFVVRLSQIVVKGVGVSVVAEAEDA